MEKAAVPSNAGGRAGEDHRRSGFQQRQRLLHGEDHRLDVAAEGVVHLFLGDLAERQHAAAAGIGEQHVEAAVRLFSISA